MLTLPIEKEIKKERKVINIGGYSLTSRQAGILLAVGITIFVMWLFDTPYLFLMLLGASGGYILYRFGTKKESGMYEEELLLKKLQQKYYNNEMRTYRTQNGYINLMNDAYQELRREDYANRATAKKAKELEKQRKEKVKHSKYKAIY